MNYVSAICLGLALLFYVMPIPIPRISSQSVCVKAFIEGRMFNQFRKFNEIPRTGDGIEIGDKWVSVKSVVWYQRSGTPIVFLESMEPEMEDSLTSVGFVELKR